METKRIDHCELKADATGTFTALISTFDKPDKFNDIVRRGAFTDTIRAWRAKGGKVPVVFSHRSDEIEQHIGEVDPAHLVEGPTGLEATGKLYLDEATAKKVFSQLQRRTLSEWSFGFLITRAKTLASGVRELLAVDLVELGPTVRGAGDTATLALKSQAGAPGPLDRYRWELDRARRRTAIALARAR